MTAAQSNEDLLRRVFSEALGLPSEMITDTLTYGEADNWDSIAHMALVAAMDAEFGTMLEMDDILDMSSFGKAKEILAKYGIGF